MKTENRMQVVGASRAVHEADARIAVLDRGEHYKLACHGCGHTVCLRDGEAVCPLCGAEIINQWFEGRDEYQRQELKKAA